MQGIKTFIPTKKKIEYINALLKVGFDTVDFGSFVSPRAVPQMQDTFKVVDKLDLSGASKLLAIVANKRGAEDACSFDQISYLGFPLSISETFQLRNTNKSISEAKKTVDEIQELCEKHNKTQVVYLSMGFGNPYGDPYSSEIVVEFSENLVNRGVKVISLADTIGSSTPELIMKLFMELIPAYPQVEFGAHLHSTPESAGRKLEAVARSGCKRMDGALLGYGGCPMAKEDLTGNMDSSLIIDFFHQRSHLSIDEDALSLAREIAADIFSKYQ